MQSCYLIRLNKTMHAYIYFVPILSLLTHSRCVNRVAFWFWKQNVATNHSKEFKKNHTSSSSIYPAELNAMGKQTLSTVKSLCIPTAASNDRVPLTYYSKALENYSKICTTKLMQIVSEMVFDFKVENYSSCIYLFPLNIFLPAYAQIISLYYNHHHKLRKFIKNNKKKKRRSVPNIHSENPKQHDLVRPESFK